MNSPFNIHRFWLLIRRHGAENLKIYALASGVIALFIVFISVLVGLYPVVLCIGGALFATTLFIPWSNFGKASFYLMLPATTTEKFLTGIVYCVLFFIPVFTLFYFLTGFVTLKLFWSSASIVTIVKEAWRLYGSMVLVDIFLAFFMLQAIVLVGTIWFNRRQFLISLFLTVLLFFFYIFLIYLTMYGITGTKVITVLLPFYNYGFGIEKPRITTTYYHFTKSIGYLNYLIWSLTIVFLYITAWYKLREREL
jgi:hypothetical protein